MGFSQNSTFGFGSKAVNASGFLTGANEGLSVSGPIVQLGQTLDQAGDPALVDQTRQIPFTSIGKVLFSLQGTSTATKSIAIQPGSIEVNGQSIINFQLAGGTNNNPSLSAGQNLLGLTDWGVINVYPSSGTNVASSIALIPKGNGVLSALQSELVLFGSDFITDNVNYSAFYIRTLGDRIEMASTTAGTGFPRYITFFAGQNTDQLVLALDGNIGMSVGSGPAAKLDMRNDVIGSSSNGTIKAFTTWNTTGAPTAFSFAVSDSASDAASIIFDVQYGSGSIFKIDKNGTTTFFNRSLSPSAFGTLVIAPTWLTTGSPTAILVNPLNSASGANATLLDLQLSSVSRFKVDKNGTTTLTNSLGGSSAIGNLVINPTWNTTGSPTIILVNPTNTTSGANATFLDLQLSSVSKFKVDKNGTATMTSSLTGSSAIGNLVINPTWNTTGAPTVFLINVTNTASSQFSNFLDFKLSNTSRFTVRRDGNTTINDGIISLSRSSDGSFIQINPTTTSISIVNFTDTEQAIITFINDNNDQFSIKLTGSANAIPRTVLFSSPVAIRVDATSFNFNFSGVFIGGTTTPTAKLHLGAGTAGASGAPFKLTSGTNTTTAEAGAMEYNGVNLFFTRTGTTRESVLVGNSGAAAPSTTPAGTPTDYYGTGGTNYLSTPNSWASIVINGTTYKIPLYT